MLTTENYDSRFTTRSYVAYPEDGKRESSSNLASAKSLASVPVMRVSPLPKYEGKALVDRSLNLTATSATLAPSPNSSHIDRSDSSDNSCADRLERCCGLFLAICVIVASCIWGGIKCIARALLFIAICIFTCCICSLLTFLLASSSGVHDD